MASRRSGRKPKIVYGRRDEDPDEASTEEEEEEEEEGESLAEVEEDDAVEDEKKAVKSGATSPGVRRKIVLNLKKSGGCKVCKMEAVAVFAGRCQVS